MEFLPVGLGRTQINRNNRKPPGITIMINTPDHRCGNGYHKRRGVWSCPPPPPRKLQSPCMPKTTTALVIDKAWKLHTY